MTTQDPQRTDVRNDPRDYRPDGGDRDYHPDGGDDQQFRGSGSYRTDERNEVDTQKVRETKPSLITTEFWVAMGGIAAVILAFIITDDDTLDLFRTCLLCTIIGTAYIVSRGLAKSGSRTERRAAV